MSAATMNLTNTPDAIINTAMIPKYINPPPVIPDFDFIFMLGLISSKWWINHDKKRIRVYLPESKRYLALALKREWGGTVSTVTGTEHSGVMWQTTSTRSLRKIKEAATTVKKWLPHEFYKQLMAFMTAQL